MTDTHPDGAESWKANISLDIYRVEGTEDEFIINATSEGLPQGEEALLMVLRSFIATLEEKAVKAEKLI